jgi:ABC-type sugar transport system ATPase subunit
MAQVTLNQVRKVYPNGAEALEASTFTIPDGELCVLVGPSGCGKSTMLRMVAGLEDITEGEVSIGDRVVNDIDPADRNIAMVFQNYALYPHMSVSRNMGYGLKNRGMDKAQIAAKVREAAEMLNLTEFLDRRPSQLSGGQRQRVAMGRAIVREPKVFLMDEPLSNLDAKLRVQTRTELVDLQARLGVTTVYVTHDQVEAMTMGHRVAVLDHGVLQQVDSPRRLYSAPANLFVAGFIGSPAMNLVETDRKDGDLLLGGHKVALPDDVAADVRAADTDRFVIGARPEHLSLVSDGSPCTVSVVEELGSEAFLHVQMPHQGNEQNVVVRVGGETTISRGDNLQLGVDGPVHIFNAATGERMGAPVTD